MLIDDGTDVVHIFAECARWDDVARAAAQGSMVYAAQSWRRVSDPEPAPAARSPLPRLLRRLASRLPSARSGQSLS